MIATTTGPPAQHALPVNLPPNYLWNMPQNQPIFFSSSWVNSRQICLPRAAEGGAEVAEAVYCLDPVYCVLSIGSELAWAIRTQSYCTYVMIAHTWYAPNMLHTLLNKAYLLLRELTAEILPALAVPAVQHPKCRGHLKSFGAASTRSMIIINSWNMLRTPN